jgi:hypothetical protein
MMVFEEEGIALSFPVELHYDNIVSVVTGDEPSKHE